MRYVRQSTLGQVRNNKQSAILQDEELAQLLVKMGWGAEHIIRIETEQEQSWER